MEVSPYRLRVFGIMNLMLILMIDDRGCGAPPQSVCDSVIVSMINSAAVLTESTRELAKKKRKHHRLVPHQEMLFIPLCTPLPPPHPHPVSLFCILLPLSLSQRPLLVINTAVCISRMHLALTQMLKKVISGCMWLPSSL